MSMSFEETNAFFRVDFEEFAKIPREVGGICHQMLQHEHADICVPEGFGEDSDRLGVVEVWEHFAALDDRVEPILRPQRPKKIEVLGPNSQMAPLQALEIERLDELDQSSDSDDDPTALEDVAKISRDGFSNLQIGHRQPLEGKKGQLLRFAAGQDLLAVEAFRLSQVNGPDVIPEKLIAKTERGFTAAPPRLATISAPPSFAQKFDLRVLREETVLKRHRRCLRKSDMNTNRSGHVPATSVRDHPISAIIQKSGPTRRASRNLPDASHAAPERAGR